MLLLREADVRALLSMEDLIRLMEDALRAFSTGGVLQPVRVALPVEPHAGYLGVMPAFMRTNGALAAKLVTFYPKNAESHLPTHLAVILLWNSKTGEVLAMMDGRLITEMRTAATSAAATKVLARADASTLAVLGSGVQARSHLEALRLVRSIRAVRVWSRTPAHARQFARDMSQEFGIGIEPAATGEAAVLGADLIVTATSATSPVLRGEWLSKGAHINAVGAPRPMWRELNTEAVSRSRVFVDSRAGALTEAGDLLIPMKEEAIGESHIVGEIGEVLAGLIEGRRGMDDITLFKSLGMAVEDVATAHHVDKRARERGIGEEVTL
ncbi:MAG: ornithine cyclodeaminase family protein [bacterium]